MKNLIHLGERRRRLLFNDGDDDNDTNLQNNSNSHLVDTCQLVVAGEDDDEEGESIVALTNDGQLTRISGSHGKKVKWKCNLQEFNLMGWFDVSYVDPPGELVCLSHMGAIVTVNPLTGIAELVGEFDYGLQTAAWSPDGEVLLMVTSAASDDDDDEEDGEEESNTNSTQQQQQQRPQPVLMSMNSQLEVLAEVPIPQYQPYVDADKNIGSADISNKISVSWRPDGSLCCVSSVDLDDNMRKLRFYKRETLDVHAIGRSEDASGTLIKNIQPTTISWAGPGCSQLLAAVQRKTKKTQQVIFYESNGLRHREFVLKNEKPTTQVISLTWNVNSDLLAVSLREEVDAKKTMDKMQIWHRCNYHWYMKQEFRYDHQKDGQIEKIKFDEEDSSLLKVIFRNFEKREYQLRWDPSTVWNIYPRCLAFVIDGCSLHMTPFEKALIPPPMSMNQIILPCPINQIIFSHPNSTNRQQQEQPIAISFAILSDGNLALLDNPNWTISTSPKPKIIDWVNNDDDNKKDDSIDILSLRSFCMVGSDGDDVVSVIAVACALANQECERIVELQISGLKSDNPQARIVKSHPVEGPILRLAPWSDSDTGCLVELEDGSLFEYETAFNNNNQMEGRVLPLEVEPLLEPCPWIHGIKDISPFEHRNNDDNLDDHHLSDSHYSRLVFGLSARSRLYCHDMMLTDSASSFSVSMPHEYLCYATAGSRCQMRFLPLKEITGFDPLMGMDQNHLLQGYEPRNVERGTRIVAILPAKPMAVLQMPRGNLEGIYPRALVLHSAMLQIIKGRYGDAFRLMRTHKVDLNLIVDMDPIGFLGNGLPKFFEQVTVIDHINLFISGLQDWDITMTRFQIPGWFWKENMSDIDDPSNFDYSSKVNQVCSKARQTMREIENRGEKDQGHFLLPVLSTFAKEKPPRLDEALGLIKENALRRVSASSAATTTIITTSTKKKNPLFSEKAQSSIHYLAFLAEYEYLFNTALGMYDYDLARAVARNSQMDPKVYLPLLKRLIALPEYFAKYEVDMKLKRYDAALKNLVKSHMSHEEVESFLNGNQNGENVEKGGNTFESCMSLIETHNLHSLGLQLFKDDSAKTHQIYISLGESKLKESRPEVALSVFLAAKPPHLDGAKRAARAAGDWRFFFSLLMEEEKETKASKFESFDDEEDTYIRIEKRRQVARDVADSIATGDQFNTSKTKQDRHLDAARILLDYGDDLIGAVDLLLAAELWSETYRIASLRERPDLMKRCVDTANSYAYCVMDDFNDRVSGFTETNTRYGEVLKLRKNIIATEGPEIPEAMETDSLFSAATTASNMSLQSSGSMGSTASNVTSSVISVKSANTFSIVGAESTTRHKSKFSKKEKKKKKKKPRKNRRRPGSEEEVQELVGSLRSLCPDKDFAKTITETIRFLIFIQNYSLAKGLFEGYNNMCSSIEQSRLDRIAKTSLEKEEAERRSRLGGGGIGISNNPDDALLFIELLVEKEIDGLLCVQLPETLVEFFNITSI